MKRIIKIILLFIFLFILIFLVNIDYKDFVVIYNKNNIYISEILAVNKSIIKDMDNEYSDYIELYNDNDYEINLKNYFLSDETMSSKKWVFPNLVIKPNEYLMVYASGKDKCNLDIRECHTNFKLSSKGETVALLNNNGEVISKVKYTKIDKDISYSLINGGFKFTVPTPNSVNSDADILKNNYKDIIINEVSSINSEFIELKNITDKDIDLANYYIKDNSGVKYQFKDVNIKANSFLVLYGSDDAFVYNNNLYAGFHVNNNDEILYLYKNGQLIDTFNVGKMDESISKGRNEQLEVVIYKEKTPGKNNSQNSYIGFSLVPSFSIDGGYVEKGTKIILNTKDNSDIYYTVDGSAPTNKSNKYTGEIIINDNTVIRAISYRDGYVESDIESRTFLVGRKHDLPVVSISTDSYNLYGNSGIFSTGNNASFSYPYYGANFWWEKEVPISFEFYEEGVIGLSFNAGMEIFGGWSRGEAQKSVAIHLRKKYGLQEITYPFFEDNVNTFSEFILQSGGQDFGKLKLKDAFLQESLDGKMDIDKQDYRPVVVYINGTYYGIYNIREKTDTSYVERHYGYDKTQMDFIEKNDGVKAGSIDEYNKLLDYVKHNDMTSDETFKYLDSQVDLQELINYWVVETYFDQFDPMNIKFYKVSDGKWRWILFDLDQSFFNWSYKTIKWNLPFEPYAHGNNYYLNTTLMHYLIKNPKFRGMYIETFAYHLNNTFQPDRMIGILDKMVNEIETEMPYHIQRWYKESIRVSTYTLDNINEWYDNIEYFKRQLRTRHDVALKTIKKGLGLTDEEYKKYFK